MSQAQPPAPDTADILKKVSETYKRASQYELVMDVSMRANASKAPIKAHFRVAFRAPNQYRMEAGALSGPGINGNEGDGTFAVYDGSTLWGYIPKLNQYTGIPAAEMATDREAGVHTPELTDMAAMQKYRTASDLVSGAKLLREETVDFEGARVNCYVVSVTAPRPGPYTWWVEETSFRVLREDTKSGTITYTKVSLGEPLPDSLFQFTPPPEAIQVTRNTQ